MKVEATTVVEFLDQVKALAEGIDETVRSGDDGFEESVQDQVERISKVIEVFKLQQLTPVTQIDPASKKYGRIYDQLCEKEDKTDGEILSLYRSELYFVMKRLAKECTTIAEVKNEKLPLFIESLLPTNSNYNKLIYSDKFYYSSMKVIQEVADEIIEERAKAPQQKLF